MSSPQITRMFGRSVGIAGLRVAGGLATALPVQPTGATAPPPHPDGMTGMSPLCKTATGPRVGDGPIDGHVPHRPLVPGGGREKLLGAAAQDGVAVVGVFAIAV